MSDIVLGISAYYHDSAAALIINGEVIAAAQEERFSRIKNDSSFPQKAIFYVLSEAGIDPSEIKTIAFYDKPFLKFERLLETYHAFAPKGFRSFKIAIPVWIKEKLFFKRMLRKELKKVGAINYNLFFPEHHMSHAASAFFPSPFEEAAILTIDGVGEWATTTISKGSGNHIEIIKELHFPHSLGLLYSAFTAYCGFKVNSGEYKLMGLAPYGDIDSKALEEYKTKITDQLIDVREDGSFLLNMNYFEFATGLRMYNRDKWISLFGFDALPPDSTPDQKYADLALAIQQVTEEVILKLTKTAVELTGSDNLVMAGGVALNSVANEKIRQSGIAKEYWIQPAAGDAGGALGAALAVHYIENKNKRTVLLEDGMKNAALGPEFSRSNIEATLKKQGAVYVDFVDQFDQLVKEVAELLSNGNVVGWFQGRMEFGPRALGNRSILADPRNTEMQSRLNLKIKMREGFRPFAPIVLEEEANLYFDLVGKSPYMQYVTHVNDQINSETPTGFSSWSIQNKLDYPKGDLPAITHVDGSARVQTVSKKTNNCLFNLLSEFKKITNVGVLINTSFNERGEPIVCTPDDAFKTFMRTGMDVLVIGDFLILKKDQILKSEEFEKKIVLD